MRISFISVVVSLFLTGMTFAQQPLKLWYNKPAKAWTQALPVGNGRLGVMVFGRADEELLQLNESTLWSGGPANLNPNPDAPTYLPQVRKALDEEDYELATKLTKKLQGLYTESYEPLGDLLIRQSLNGPVTNYYRDLNISDAIATTRFTVAGVTYTREVFVSAPDQVIVVRLTASQKGKLNVVAATKSPLHYTMTAMGNRDMTMTGKAPAHTDPSYLGGPQEHVIYADTTQCRGMRFALRMRVLPSDGTAMTDTAGLHVSNATSVVLLLSAATSFNGFDKCPDKDGKNEKQLAEAALSMGVEEDVRNAEADACCRLSEVL